MSQIFQKPLPKDILHNFLIKYCENNHDHLLFSKVAFKKMKLQENSIQNFYNLVKPYYYNSKRYYLSRDKTYKNLITVIRQICKFLHIPYTSKIIYFKSTYEIIYYIYKDKEQVLEEKKKKENEKNCSFN